MVRVTMRVTRRLRSFIFEDFGIGARGSEGVQ